MNLFTLVFWQPCANFLNRKLITVTFRCFLLVIFLDTNQAFGQKKFSVQVGGGLGHALDNGKKKNRFKIQVNGYYNISNQLSAGIELASTDALIYPISDEVTLDPVINAIIFDASNVNGALILSKLKYYWTESGKDFRPFIEFGAGLNTYTRTLFNLSGTASQKVKQTNFAIQPEAGFSFKHFQVSIGYLFAGNTPSFIGVNAQGQNIVLESTHLPILYFNANWRFDF
jgi:hypothetical protein